MKRIILFSVLTLLITAPSISFAWHDYEGGYWDYYGSGRDHPYSYYIDQYYNPGYVQTGVIDIDSYVPPLPAQITQVPVPSTAHPEEFTVTFPNNHGGYTAVVIKKSGNGFIGPKGEYYPEFPKVFQLEITYGK